MCVCAYMCVCVYMCVFVLNSRREKGGGDNLVNMD